MRVFAVLLSLGCLVLASAPAEAHTALPPGQAQGKYARWSYPSQVSYGPIETGAGNTGMAPARGAFLTLPFMGPHYITSLFSHCYPDYGNETKVCRYDGVTASASVGGPDPDFTAGFAQTPGGHDYLYYAGHDGYDYGLFYEPVAAAAPGRVIYAGAHGVSGLIVEVDHGNGLLTYYGHMSHIWVTARQYVYRGQVLGISGMSGVATGPHLHFGVYYVNGAGPVDPYGWSGSYPDPWPKDIGDLWLTGSPRFANVPLPHVTISATPRLDNPNVVDVSWSSPGTGTHFTVYAVSTDGVQHSWSGSYGDGHAAYGGRPGEEIWFWATVSTDLGWWDGGGSAVVQIPHPSHGGVAT